MSLGALDHIRRVSALARAWDRLRGPGQALLPEDVAGILDGVDRSREGAVPEDVKKRISAVEVRLVHVLTDPGYLNDDRDREVIVARMALCGVLQDLRKMDGLGSGGGGVVGAERL